MGQTFLLVDDNEADHFLTRTIIEKVNGSVSLEHAYDGNEALKLLRTGIEPDLILLDISMPGLDGFGFLEAYSNSDDLKKTTIVMLTSSYAETDKTKAFEYDVVQDYICKPLKTDDLERLKAMGKHSAGSKNITLE